MRKILLIDGNSMFFRAFFASSYGSRMTTSFNVETNAVYTFSNMIFKAISLLEPTNILVAFDSGVKSVRNQWYPEYKGTRKEVDPSLIGQIPIAYEFLDSADIKHCHIDGVEADDIIGSLSVNFPNDKIMVLTSDKDLLQLISENVDVYLMKQGISELLKVDTEKLFEMYTLAPKQIIELKSLMGDSSDNIPGVKGIGEKTAIKLLAQYKDLDGIYQHIDEIKGSLHTKLVNNQDIAFLSKKLATIITDIVVDINIDDTNYDLNRGELYKFYVKYEMNSLASKIGKNEAVNEINYTIINSLDNRFIDEKVSIFVDRDTVTNDVYGVAISSKEGNYYCLIDNANLSKILESNAQIIVYDYKNICHIFNLEKDNKNIEDLMIVSFLVDSQINNFEKLMAKNCVALTQNNSTLYGTASKKNLGDIELRAKHYCLISEAIFKIFDNYYQQLVKDEMLDLYNGIERPLAFTLYKMEREGIKVDVNILKEIAKDTLTLIENLTSEIYLLSTIEFNINSPKQLSEVLFDKLGLKANKKRSTSQEELEKLKFSHEVIPLILEYRKYQKLYSTYAEGLQKYVKSDGKIHTTFQQCLTQTGRLSSTEPNLQNIGIRSEEVRGIRKAFIPEHDYILSADYSQVELRFLAHLSQDQEMIKNFNQDYDIHTATACAIYNFEPQELTPLMRRNAKAVNFGIVYGISDFGLANQLEITRKQAQEFINHYFKVYPNIQVYMNKVIEECQKTGYVTTMCNHKRMIPEINDKNYAVREFGKRAAMNAPIQGSAADLIKIAMLNIDKRLEKEGLTSKMIVSVHDELLFDVKENELTTIHDLVKEEMETAMKLDVPLKVDISYDRNWYGAK